MNTKWLMLGAGCLLALAQPANALFSNGSGTQADPYWIEDSDDLNNIRNDLGEIGSPVYYVQVDDIDLDHIDNWEPIGTSGNRAYVHYDGNGHRISNLNISRASTFDVGLFGVLRGSVTALAVMSGNITGEQHVGSIVGYMDNGIVSNVVSMANVTGRSEVGGLVGFNEQGSEIVDSAYRWGTVSGTRETTFTGGIVGYNRGIVRRSYAAGLVQGNGMGLSGRSGGSGQELKTYWDTEVSQKETSAGDSIGLPTAQMKIKDSFEDWNFSDVWQLYESYPYHQIFAETVSPVVFDPDGGAFTSSPVDVTVSSATTNATIYYTIEERDEPDVTTSNNLAPGNTTEVGVPGVLRAVAWAPYMNPYPGDDDFVESHYEVAALAAMPEVSPGSGSYVGVSNEVTITSETSGASIYYTLDGSEPTESSYLVTDEVLFAPIPSTLKARAYHPDYSPSAVTTVVYTAADTVSAPIFDPNGGSFAETNVSVTLDSATDDATIYYTLDGSEPVEGSDFFVSAGSVISVPIPSVLKAQAFKTNMNASAVTEAEYVETGRASMPTFSPTGGSIASGNVQVTLESIEADAVIYYTTDGSEPDSSSPSVGSGETINLPVPSTLQAMVTSPSLTPSDVRVAVFETADVAETPVFSEEWITNGDDAVTVTITSVSPAATILYSMDGSDPLYDGSSISSGDSITVTAPVTVRARAQSDGLFVSPVGTAFYGDFAGGEGTAENPYLIADAEQLNRVREDLKAHYQLVDHIDLSDWSSGEGWEPIGVWKNGFAGTFDGAGHRIENVSMDRSEEDDVALFGYVTSSGVVKAFGITGVSVTGGHYVGSIVGYLEGTVEQVYALGAVTGDQNVGGLVGYLAHGGGIYDAYAMLDVAGNDYVGGAVGRNSQGNMAQIYSTGAVSGSSKVGGLVGFYIEGSNSSISSSFWDVNTSGIPESGGGEGLSTSAMYQAETYTGWDFDAVWSIDEGNDYPKLQDSAADVGNVPPESWLTRFYGSAEAAPERSVKGQTLWHEYVAGTDPADPDSRFRLQESLHGEDNLTLRFPSVTGRRYRVAKRADLLQGEWKIISGVEAIGTDDVLELEIPLDGDAQFYRLIVDLNE